MMNNDRMMVVVRTLEDNRRSGLCEHAVEAGIGRSIPICTPEARKPSRSSGVWNCCVVTWAGIPSHSKERTRAAADAVAGAAYLPDPVTG